MDAARLWRTRVTWALVGAAITLAITSLREPSGSNSRDEVRTEVSVATRGDAAPVVVATAEPSKAEPSKAEPSKAEPVEPPIPTIVAPIEPIPSTELIPSTEPEPIIEPAPAPVPTPFEIPLPLMPGARVMKRSQRADAEHGGVIVTLALSVPAPGIQVEQFYRAALADAKLAVSGGSTQPSTMGTGLRSSLRGRSRDARVNVNLRQPAGRLRTVVRIIWQTLP